MAEAFAVIAEEVRKLSSQTKDASAHIAGLIDQLQKRMSDFQQSMMDTRRSLDQQDGQVEVTLDSFKSIDSSMKAISGQIMVINEQVDRTGECKDKLAEAVRTVAGIAEKTAAGVEEVNASSTLQNGAIRHIAGQAEEIHDLSRRLFDQISQFVLEDQKQDQAG